VRPRSDSTIRTSAIAALSIAAGMTAMSCNPYEFFRVAGYEQVGFSNKAEILFVIDSSASMRDEAADLVANFDTFIQILASAEGAEPATETLSDAVGNYLTYTGERGRLMDYRIGITTTSADYGPDIGFENGVEPGEAGTLIGGVLQKGQDDIIHQFRRDLACRAACWDGSELPSDASYTGTTGNCPLPDIGVTREYLDCLCTDVDYPVETATWDSADICGSGHEKHMEAALLTLCRSVEEPPSICWDHAGSNFDEEDDVGTVVDFLREGTPIVIVIVTDEGDGSPLFSASDDNADPYLEAFAQFDRDITFAVIGPPLECEDTTSDLGNSFDDCQLTCNSGNASQLQTERLIDAAAQTNGFYNFIAEPDEECDVSSFVDHLEDLGELLVNLQTAFQLQTVPDQSTIQVYVDDEPVDKAQLDDNGDFDSGWTYDPSQNAVVFWGKAIPDFNQNVRIFYRPLEGKPRNLPF
jgi:hypothetical protein